MVQKSVGPFGKLAAKRRSGGTAGTKKGEKQGVCPFVPAGVANREEERGCNVVGGDGMGQKA